MNKIFIGLSIFALAAMADTQAEADSLTNPEPDMVLSAKELNMEGDGAGLDPEAYQEGEEHH